MTAVIAEGMDAQSRAQTRPSPRSGGSVGVHRRRVRRRPWLQIPAWVLLASLSACGPDAGPDVPGAERIRHELQGLIEDVAGSTAHQHQLRDTDGRRMGPMDVIWSPEAEQFAAVHFTWEEPVGAFVVRLATSDDLLTWEEVQDYSVGGSQPSVARTPSGRYVVAWEQEPDPIHLSLIEFATWDDLVTEGGSPRFMELPVTTPGCGEGTPDITSATDERVELTFHYHAGCERDLQASGSTDWTGWAADLDRDLDAALDEAGVTGHIGDRTSFTYRGRRFVVVEGETVPGDWASWRLYLYDPAAGIVDQLDIRTDGGSRAFSNPSVDVVTIDGRQSLLVTTYLFTEGAATGEDGTLLYYRPIPDS